MSLFVAQLSLQCHGVAIEKANLRVASARVHGRYASVHGVRCPHPHHALGQQKAHSELQKDPAGYLAARNI